MAITVDDKAAVNVSLSPTAQTDTGTGGRRVTVYRNGQELAATMANGKTTLDSGESLREGDTVTAGNGQTYIYNEKEGRGIRANDYGALLAQQYAADQKAREESESMKILQQMQNWQDQYVRQTQQLYDQIAAKQKAETDYATQQAVNNLKRQWEDTRGTFEQERAKTAYSSAQAADNLALSRARAGDRGGIGNKQYSEQQNYYDQAILDIDLQQANLKNQIDRQVADYIAQGDYENARATYELGIAQMEQLINQQNQMLNYQIGVAATVDNLRVQADNVAYQRALNNLSMGMFSPEDAATLGVDPAQAQAYADRLNLEAQINLDAAQAALEAQYLKNAGYTASGNKTGGGSGSGNSGSGLSQQWDKLLAMYGYDPYAAMYYTFGAETDDQAASILTSLGIDRNDAKTIMTGYGNSLYKYGGGQPQSYNEYLYSRGYTTYDQAFRYFYDLYGNDPNYAAKAQEDAQNYINSLPDLEAAAREEARGLLEASIANPRRTMGDTMIINLGNVGDSGAGDTVTTDELYSMLKSGTASYEAMPDGTLWYYRTAGTPNGLPASSPASPVVPVTPAAPSVSATGRGSTTTSAPTTGRSSGGTFNTVPQRTK